MFPQWENNQSPSLIHLNQIQNPSDENLLSSLTLIHLKLIQYV